MRTAHDGERPQVWVDVLALISPVLALPAGAGWYLLAEDRRPLAALGILLWYLGMVFVIAQDALQVAVVTTLPSAYVAADASIRCIPALGIVMLRARGGR